MTALLAEHHLLLHPLVGACSLAIDLPSGAVALSSPLHPEKLGKIQFVWIRASETYRKHELSLLRCLLQPCLFLISANSLDVISPIRVVGFVMRNIELAHN